jgi:hypothetical protein
MSRIRRREQADVPLAEPTAQCLDALKGVRSIATALDWRPRQERDGEFRRDRDPIIEEVLAQARRSDRH